MGISGWFTAIIVGAIIGALGRLVVPGRQGLPIWATILIGIVAALIGTTITRQVMDVSGFNLVELLVQVGVAAGLVFGVSAIAGRNKTSV